MSMWLTRAWPSPSKPTTKPPCTGQHYSWTVQHPACLMTVLLCACCQHGVYVQDRLTKPQVQCLLSWQVTETSHVYKSCYLLMHIWFSAPFGIQPMCMPCNYPSVHIKAKHADVQQTVWCAGWYAQMSSSLPRRPTGRTSFLNILSTCWSGLQLSRYVPLALYTHSVLLQPYSICRCLQDPVTARLPSAATLNTHSIRCDRCRINGEAYLDAYMSPQDKEMVFISYNFIASGMTGSRWQLL